MSHYQQFEIPDTWKWTTLEELIILISGQDFPSDKYSSTPKGIPYIIGASNIQNEKVVVTRWTESPTVLSEKNDLLIICKGAGIGKMGINQIGTSHIARQLQALRPFSCYVSLEYIRVALMNGIEIICSQANGLIPGLSRDLLLKFPIPLPPLAEQMKIVNRVASALDNINVLEMEAAAAQDYISLLKSKILDLAMQGKLVPQDPADEPAADMLLRINPNAKIITDNPHLRNIPKNWCITDLKSIGKWQAGATPSKMNSDFYGIGYPWLNTGDLTDDYIYTIPKQITELALKETSVKLNPKGSVLIAMYGATIGKLGILTFPATTNQACCACAECYINNKFLFYFLKYYRPQFLKMGGGGAQSNISKEKIKKTILLLPPNNEQKRIVNKIEELYSIFDDIEASLQS